MDLYQDLEKFKNISNSKGYDILENLHWLLLPPCQLCKMPSYCNKIQGNLSLKHCDCTERKWRQFVLISSEASGRSISNNTGLNLNKLTLSQRSTGRRLSPVFSGMKRLGVFLLPPGWVASSHPTLHLTLLMWEYGVLTTNTTQWPRTRLELWALNL